MSNEEADVFANMLRTMGIGVEHPALMRWVTEDPHELDVKQQIVDAHAPGKEPLLRFEPGAEPQRVDNSTPITIQPGHPTTVNVAADPSRERAWPKAVAKPLPPASPSPRPGLTTPRGRMLLLRPRPAPDRGREPRLGRGREPRPDRGRTLCPRPSSIPPSWMAGSRRLPYRLTGMLQPRRTRRHRSRQISRSPRPRRCRPATTSRSNPRVAS
jgi:hypothetical protein